MKTDRQLPALWCGVSHKMKQQELQVVLLRSLIIVATAAVGSLAIGYLLRRILAPKTSDADVQSALKKLYEIEVP